MTMTPRVTMTVIILYYYILPFCILETLLFWESWDCWLLRRVQLYCLHRESEGELVSAPPSPYRHETLRIIIELEKQFKIKRKGFNRQIKVFFCGLLVKDGRWWNQFIRYVGYIWWLPKVWKDNFPDCWGWFNFLHYIISIVCIQSTLHKRYNTILLLK